VSDPDQNGGQASRGSDPSGFFDALQQLPREYRFFGLFLLIVCITLLYGANAEVTPTKAVVGVVGLSLAFVVTLIVLLRGVPEHVLRQRLGVQSATLSPELRRHVRSRLRRLRVTVGMTMLLLSLGTLWMAHVRGWLAPLFPASYPGQTAELAVRAYFRDMDRMLRVRQDRAGLLEAVRAFSEHMEPAMLERHFQKLPELTQVLLGQSSLSSSAGEELERYRSWYGDLSGAAVENISVASWRPIRRADNQEEIVMLAVVAFRGRFVTNEYARNAIPLPMLVQDFQHARDEAQGPLADFLRKAFPHADPDAIATSLGSIDVQLLVADNAVDVLTMRSPSLKRVDPNAFKNGMEICLYSIRLTRVNGQTWRIAEPGRFGLKRFVTGE
jgi:hypothetical protein